MLTRGIIWALVTTLMGCDAPDPAFRNVAPHRITIRQSVFDVRVSGAHAQAIRRNPEWAPRLPAVAPRGILAIEAVSGCRVVRLSGDQAVMEAQLDCGAGVPPLPVTEIFDCQREPVYRGYADFICSARE